MHSTSRQGVQNAAKPSPNSAPPPTARATCLLAAQRAQRGSDAAGRARSARGRGPPAGPARRQGGGVWERTWWADASPSRTPPSHIPSVPAAAPQDSTLQVRPPSSNATCSPEGLFTATTCWSHHSTSRWAGAGGSAQPGRRCASVAPDLQRAGGRASQGQVVRQDGSKRWVERGMRRQHARVCRPPHKARRRRRPSRHTHGTGASGSRCTSPLTVT